MLPSIGKVVKSGYCTVSPHTIASWHLAGVISALILSLELTFLLKCEVSTESRAEFTGASSVKDSASYKKNLADETLASRLSLPRVARPSSLEGIQRILQHLPIEIKHHFAVLDT